jgi:hypothetical protein
MEWDLGAPWYRATCVHHIVSGAEYGWRQGTNVWPAYFEDSLPRVVDVGLGSPTGVKFGAAARFQEPYRRALFLLDWAYGRILVVHLTPRGATYSGKVETFLQGRPLNATDLAFGPDGAMYFVVGGRRTQSVLYRVRYTGPLASAVPAPDDETAAAARKTRREMESFHRTDDTAALAVIWPRLGDVDRWIRNAARVSLERRPLGEWLTQALADEDPTRALTALLAATRVAGRDVQPPVLRRLNEWVGKPLSREQMAIALRAYQLSLVRQGAPASQARSELLTALTRLYPARTA